MHRLSWILLLWLIALSGPSAANAAGDMPFSEVSVAEQRTLVRLLDSPHWPLRVFALMRLERFTGDDITPLVLARVGDADWPVRCFALRQAFRMQIPVTAQTLAAERDARVIRAALWYGVELPPEQVEPIGRKLMRTKALDELMVGLEIAAASEIDALRLEATRRLRRVLRNMDDAIVIRIATRLGRLVGETRPPTDVAGWRAWLEANGGTVELAHTAGQGGRADADAPPLAATLDAETFSRLIDYLDGLRQRDLELVVVMDATYSMVPMVNESRAGIDSLILFLNDLSRTMRLAFIAYRDHDNEPVWEGHPFTTDVNSIRRFLFDLRLTGGRDLPEAVLEGLTACGELEWNRSAARQIVLVGDARPHEQDTYKITGLLESFRESGIVVHAVHVPMQENQAFAVRMTPAQRQYRQREIADHNRLTEDAFGAIAGLGGGDRVTLHDADQLVPAIMHLTIEEGWWVAFDEFYALYLGLCR